MQEEVNYIPYYLKVYEADSLFVLKDYEGSYRILDSLFKKYEPINMPVFFEYNTFIASSIMTGNSFDIESKIKKSLTKFGSYSVNSSDYKKLSDTIFKLSKLEKDEVQKLKDKYYNSLSFELIAEIDTLVREDQSVRGSFYSKEKIRFYLNKHIIDINKIFEQNGYPSDKLIGNDLYFDENNIKTYSNFYILLIHQAEVNDVILDLLAKILIYVKNGSCSPTIYADIYDKYIWNTQNMQYFGTITGENIEQNVPLLNHKKIDSIRKSIGLTSYKYFDWRDKKDWSE